MRAILGLVLVASLTACGSEPVTENAADSTASEANATLEAPANQGAATAGNATASEDAAAQAIPAALLGDWALVAGDCTTQWGDAKGLLTVTPTELRFYESRGKIGKVIESSPSRVTADFAFQGEGEEWERRMTLEADNGELVRRESGEGAATEAFRYRRCPT